MNSMRGIRSRAMTIATRTDPDRIPAIAHDDDHESVAIHSTVLGPALGGLRLRRYPGGLREGLDDVMALARTMTLKASAAGLDLGGGKAVLLDDGEDERREARLIGAAKAIDELRGAYITAEDIGTTTA